MELMYKDLCFVIRGIVVWVIGKIGDYVYVEEFEKVFEKEQDEEVKLEIEKGIELLKVLGMIK